MLVLTHKYGSLIDQDLLKKQKEPLINHRLTIDLNQYKKIEKAYLAFLSNKDKYIICYKPKNVDAINNFVKSLGEIDILDVNWIDVSELDSLCACFYLSLAKHIVGLDRWDVSNVKNMSSMFRNCDKLESISGISGWDVSNVELMRFMFSGCKKLESIGDISWWNVSHAEDIHSMFSECFKLESIGDISGWDVSKVEDMLYMFDKCEKLESIGDISGWDISCVDSMFCMFSGCINLKTVGDLNKWDVSNVSSKVWMFSGSAIQHLPDWYKSRY